MNEIDIFKESKTDIKSTVFGDGMIVNADDLTTAMNYPLEMFRTLVRAYFGCGVVCGLELSKYPDDAKDTYCVQVGAGTALDCNANGLKLCDALVINLKPDPCFCGVWPDCFCIAIRRTTEPEGKRLDGDDCDTTRQCQHRRLREVVTVRAFPCDDLPKDLCAHDEQDVVASNKPHDLCECLKECGGCECCDDTWVLLGCVKLGECGVEEFDFSRRKYVKPIECHCKPAPDPNNGQGRKKKKKKKRNSKRSSVPSA